MTQNNFISLVQVIVSKAKALNESHTDEINLPVNYACIFSQSEPEFNELALIASELGAIVQETAMGPVFKISAIETEAGDLKLLKIRKPDLKRTEKGDADFTLSNYEKFKTRYLGKSGFNLIKRKEMEMIELSDPKFDVLAYYSHPTLEDALRLK